MLQIVPAVSELIMAELMYLNYVDPMQPALMYLNCPGTANAAGEPVGLESEAMAIYDCMQYVSCPVHTVNVGLCIGQASLLLAAGEKGHRSMLPNSTAMLCQPRTPDSGQRQALELAIKSKEILHYKDKYLEALAEATGQDAEKLDRDTARPFYMQPQDCIEYGVADVILNQAELALPPDVAARASGAAEPGAGGLAGVAPGAGDAAEPEPER